MKPAKRRYTYARKSVVEDAPPVTKAGKTATFCQEGGSMRPLARESGNSAGERGIKFSLLKLFCDYAGSNRHCTAASNLETGSPTKSVIRTLLGLKPKVLRLYFPRLLPLGGRPPEKLPEQPGEQNLERRPLPPNRQKERRLLQRASDLVGFLSCRYGQAQDEDIQGELEATKKKKKDKAVQQRDSSTIRLDSLVGPIVDSLMTRHDRSLLGDDLDEVGLEAEQNALKKKEATSTPAADKAQEDNLAQTNRLGGHKAGLERKWCGRPKIEKDRELEAPDFDSPKRLGGPRRVTPTLAAKEGGQEDLEITSGEDERMKEMPSVNQRASQDFDLNERFLRRGYEIAFE
ncbi:hypothetical protein FNV43_RR18990 [Rhamnella rubrinervis]|uniref:Uncharacterized protein n=1 Tax=Rhamnella rubrinervis TaxID=2594499 RepID=A0A8K0E7B2_9ROSA|nr:hypothetical protein FNV43_RR18990 [Rhamnella rubrinervis]